MRRNLDYSRAAKLALKVDFITTGRELYLYTNAIYDAMRWGREIDKRNKSLSEKEKSVK